MNDRPNRPRGTLVYPMPPEVNGPLGDHYALVLRDTSEGLQARMVHTEGVAYLVTADKPWCWTDYDPSQPTFTMDELINLIDVSKETDLADWVRTFGARLETNFAMVYAWANEE